MKTFITILCVLFLIVTAHAAERIKIGAGGSNGEYTNTIVPAISKALMKYGYEAKAVISAGSQENIDNILGIKPIISTNSKQDILLQQEAAILSEKLLVALVQLDVAALNIQYDVDETLVLLGGKIAPEALYCAVQKEGNVKSYADLTDPSNMKNPIKISIGKERSGTSKTFQYLMKLDPDLKKEYFEFHHGNTQSELSRLNSGRRDIVCFVINPNHNNKLIKQVSENDQLIFIDIDKPVFANAKIGHFNVYNILDVPYASTSRFMVFKKSKTVKTLVTWVYLIANDKELDNEKLKTALINVANKRDLLPKNSVVGKAKAMICKAVPRLCEE